MKNRNRLTATALALILLLSFLLSAASCAGNTDKADETTPPAAEVTTLTPETEPEETEFNAKSILGERDFGGKTVCFYSSVYNGAWISDLFHEDNDGDVLGSAVFKRNELIKSQYNVELEQKESGSRTFADKLAIQVKSNDTSFNLVYMGLADAATAAIAGNLYNLNTLQNIHTDGSWWNGRAAAAWSLANKLYFMTGDITTTDNMSIRMMYFNKNLIKDLRMKSPYDMVADNTWTFENYFTMVEQAAADATGDGVTINDDTFGVVAQTTFGFMMTTAAGEMLTYKGEGDMPVCVYKGDTTRLVDVTEALTGYIAGHNSVYLGADEDIMSIFTSGRSLFMAEVLLHCKTMRMNYDVNFGLLPMPKYNADQDCYYQYFTGYCTTVTGVPYHVQDEDLDRASFILEALAVESVMTVTPAFTEVCLKGRYVDDNDSASMIDIITGIVPEGAVLSDLAEVRGWGGLKSSVQDAIAHGNAVSKILKQLTTSTTKAIEKDYEAVVALP